MMTPAKGGMGSTSGYVSAAPSNGLNDTQSQVNNICVFLYGVHIRLSVTLKAL